MIIGEYIVSFTCLYLSLAYAIFYLYFQAYPIIFQGEVIEIVLIEPQLTASQVCMV